MFLNILHIKNIALPVFIVNGESILIQLLTFYPYLETIVISSVVCERVPPAIIFIEQFIREHFMVFINQINRKCLVPLNLPVKYLCRNVFICRADCITISHRRKHNGCVVVVSVDGATMQKFCMDTYFYT